MTLYTHKVVRVVFDEFHSEAWSISLEAAKRMQPEAPFDSSYHRAAQFLAEREFEVARNADTPFSAESLAAVDVLVIAHPSENKWERTTNNGSPRFSANEIAAVHAFVERGGGLVVLGETEHDKYGSNLNDLLAPFGVCLENATVFDYTHYQNVTSWVLARPGTNGAAATGLLTQVREICLYRAGTLRVDGPAKPALFTSDVAQPPRTPVMAVVIHGQGRVVVVADSDWLGDEFFEAHDHRRLWENIAYWVAAPAFAAGERSAVSSQSSVGGPWLDLKVATNSLRRLQNPDGSAADIARAGALVGDMILALDALAPRFPHLAGYHRAVEADLRAWLAGGCAKPDFGKSLAAFQPQTMRQDGIEHLVVFPMYTPNGSSDVRFEAVHVRVPWPAWLDELERTKYHNDKFVPLMLIDHTDGYDSECAVLFPETVSVAGKASNAFGGIFCDREARRYQRAIGKAASALRLALPPRLAAWIQSPDLVRETYMLWDLIHDTSHSHGDLPFDPFMVRQRLPYWMYSLEELRVDLWSYCASLELEKTLPFARTVQFAILLDRILRFPITGSRVRNYDGLGGQLLFAFLHQRGDVLWRDNTLIIDWDAVPAGVAELRRKVDELYRAGIDMTKVQYWIAAHELVASYVRPNLASTWAAGQRALRDEGDPKAWIAQVNDDEFPLSLFYQSLQKKMQASS